MAEIPDACVQCGADRTTTALALSSKSGFTRYVCASSGGCRRRRQLKAEFEAGVTEGRRQAAEEIRERVGIEHVPPVLLRSGALLRSAEIAEWAATIAEGTMNA